MISDDRFDKLVERAWSLARMGPIESHGPAFNTIIHLLVQNEQRPNPSGPLTAERKAARTSKKATKRK